MNLPNMDLRIYAKERGIPLWAIAREFKISLSTLHARLNSDDSEEKTREFKESFTRIVDRVSERNSKGG